MTEGVSDLISQRDALKSMIDGNIRKLALLGTDLESPLVDREGYPLPDLDIPTIRALRRETNRLLYDYKDLTRRIEVMLPEALGHAPTSTRAIAKVGQIQSGSVADQLGLLTGDLIVSFGSLNQTNYNGLTSFSEEIRKFKEERSLLTITVSRSGTIITLSLDPQQVLGFQIVPL